MMIHSHTLQHFNDRNLWQVDKEGREIGGQSRVDIEPERPDEEDDEVIKSDHLKFYSFVCVTCSCQENAI